MQIKKTIDSARIHGSPSCAGHGDPSALFRTWCLGHSGCEGGDLGSAVKEFKQGMKDSEGGEAGAAGQVTNSTTTAREETIDVEATEKS